MCNKDNLYAETIYFRTKSSPPRTYDSSREYPYPNNLIAAIKGIDPSELETEYYDSSRMKKIEVALATLTKREQAMVHMRYELAATYEQIGEYYGITFSAARQIVKNAVKKMQSTSKRIFLKDVLAEEDRAEELEAYIESVVSSRVEEKVKAVLRAEYMRGYADGLKVAEDGGGKRLLEIPIEDLDLSTRSFNCLKRSGVNKMGDFLLYDTKESIMGIKSLGKKCTEEIATKLKNYGICNEAWSQFLIPEVESIQTEVKTTDLFDKNSE